MADNPEIEVALALGSNLGDRLASLQAAVAALEPYVHISALSPVYETAPAYVTDQPVYLNAALIGKTKIEPLALLWAVKNIEREIGRLPTYRYGPRVLDIDILFYGDTVLVTPELTLPHPRLQERDFVLRPLRDIAPTWQHPVSKLTATEMFERLPDKQVMNCLGSVL